jgi:hypothetical protein
MIGPPLQKWLMLLAALILIHVGVKAQTYLSRDSVVKEPFLYAEAGFYFPSITTRLRIDSEKGPGTEIGLEDDLKLSNNLSVFRASTLFSLKGKSQLLVSFTSLVRSRELVLEEDIRLGDTVFYVGARAKLRFDVNYYAATWRYSFFDETNWNAGVSVGLRAVQFITRFDAELNANSYSESASIMAPALLIGLHGSGYLTPRLLARYALEAFYVDIKGISIYVTESNASLQYFITSNIGIGGAFSNNFYRVNDIPLSDKFDGRIVFAFGGFNLFLSARF